MNTLDMRGVPCPIPVVKAKKELERADAKGVVLIVDNLVAVQNLQKMADGKGHAFSYTNRDENTFEVAILKSGNTVDTDENHMNSVLAPRNTDDVTVLISSDKLGDGSDELGKILIKGFLFSLTELTVPIRAVVFINGGVKLATKGSNAISDLRDLGEKGVKILACGTCLNYYGITDELAVGEIADMMTIAEHLASASRLVTL